MESQLEKLSADHNEEYTAKLRNKEGAISALSQLLEKEQIGHQSIQRKLGEEEEVSQDYASQLTRCNDRIKQLEAEIAEVQILMQAQTNESNEAKVKFLTELQQATKELGEKDEEMNGVKLELANRVSTIDELSAELDIVQSNLLEAKDHLKRSQDEVCDLELKLAKLEVKSKEQEELLTQRNQEMGLVSLHMKKVRLMLDSPDSYSGNETGNIVQTEPLDEFISQEALVAVLDDIRSLQNKLEKSQRNLLKMAEDSANHVTQLRERNEQVEELEARRDSLEQQVIELTSSAENLRAKLDAYQTGGGTRAESSARDGDQKKRSPTSSGKRKTSGSSTFPLRESTSGDMNAERVNSKLGITQNKLGRNTRASKSKSKASEPLPSRSLHQTPNKMPTLRRSKRNMPPSANQNRKPEALWATLEEECNLAREDELLLD